MELDWDLPTRPFFAEGPIFDLIKVYLWYVAMFNAVHTTNIAPSIAEGVAES